MRKELSEKKNLKSKCLINFWLFLNQISRFLKNRSGDRRLPKRKAISHFKIRFHSKKSRGYMQRLFYIFYGLSYSGLK